MPTGIVVMHWDERIGGEIIGSYPINTTIEDRTLMQLYAQHEYSGEAGFVTLSVGAMNLVSYYTGPETQIYLILLLRSEEDGLDYEEAMVDLSRQIVDASDNPDTVEKLIPIIFQRISTYPTLTDEQKMALAVQDSVKQAILNRFREEIAIPKSEIEIWIKDQFHGIANFAIEGILDNLLKMGLIKFASVKGSAADMVFFVQDIMMLRRPPVELVKNPTAHNLPKSLVKHYVREVRTFFREYKISDEDNLIVLNNVILDPDSYIVFKLLRQAIVTRDDLEKLKKKGVTSIDETLRKLYEAKILVVLQDNRGVEYYAMMSDFYIGRFFPSYSVDQIMKIYKSKSQDYRVLLKALDILREEYYIQAEAQKEAEKEKSKKKKKGDLD